MAKRLKPLGTTRLGTTPTPDGVGFLVSRVVLVAVPRLSVLCFEVSLNVPVNAEYRIALYINCYKGTGFIHIDQPQCTRRRRRARARDGGRGL